MTGDVRVLRDVVGFQDKMDQLAPALHPRFLVEVADVVFDRVRRNEQLVLDVPVALSLEDQFRDLLFPFRDAVFCEKSFQNTPLPDPGDGVAVIREKRISKPEDKEKIEQKMHDNHKKILEERIKTRRTESPCLAGEHQQPLFPAVGTPDAGKPAHRIAAVEVLLDNILDDRPEIPVLLLKTILIFSKEPHKIKKIHDKKQSVPDNAVGRSLL